MSVPPNPYVSPGKSNPFPDAAGAPMTDAQGNVLLVGPMTEPPTLSVIGSFQAVFKEPNAWPLLLWFVLLIVATGFIPILPHIVLLGYASYLAEGMIRTPNAPRLTFDFEHLSKYLGRGVWGFLAAFVIGLVAAIPLAIGMVAVYLGGALLVVAASNGGEGAALAVMFLVMTIGFVVILLLNVLFQLISNLVSSRAAMAGSFGAGFDFVWIRDFLSRVGLKLFVGLIGMALLSIVVNLLGVLVCFVGVYFTAALTIYASIHYSVSVYRLYLSLGGTPIAMKPEVTLERLAG